MDIKPGAEEQYLQFLFLEKRKGRMERITSKISRKSNGEYKKGELAEEMAEFSGTSERHARNFLNKLQEHGCLERTGEVLTASKPVPIWKVDKKRLFKQVTGSEWYDERVDLMWYLMNKNRDL